MRALKVLVIGMGILIVIGVGAVGYGLYTKSSSLVKKTMSVPSLSPSSKISKAWGQDLMVSLPLGCVIEKIKTGSNRIYVIISGTPREGQTVCSRVVVVDSLSGQRLGTIKVVP
jgi:hypothetical protein